MTTNFLYSGNAVIDKLHILSFINSFTKKTSIPNTGIDLAKIDFIVKTINDASSFPCKNGIANASVFKKVAYFVCCFVSAKPLKAKFPKDIVGETIHSISNHQNALIAFEIAQYCLYKAKIIRKSPDEEKSQDFVLDNLLEYSEHSLIDILEAIAEAKHSHFKLLTILFEQLAYKTNSKCQYPIDLSGLPECP